VTGCLCPTSADNFPILAGIQPAELRRNGAVLSLVRRAMEPGHLLHSGLTPPSSADAWRLKSKHSFVLDGDAEQLITSSDNNNVWAAQWADHQWNAELADNTTRLRIFIRDTGTELPSQEEPAHSLTASAPVLDVFAPDCTNGVWPPLRYVSVAQKNKSSATMSVLQYPIHRPPNGLHGLTVLDDKTTEWLLNTCPEIYCSNAVVRTTSSKEEEESRIKLSYEVSLISK